MNPTHTLRTKRLALHAAAGEALDAALLGKVELARHLGVSVPASWPPDGFGRHRIEAASEALRSSPTESGWRVWFLVLEDHTLVGIAGFGGKPSAEGVVTIQGSIAPEHGRNGYASEALPALLDWAFVHRGVMTVACDLPRGSDAASRLLARAGFKRSGRGHEAETDRYELSRADHQSARLKAHFGERRSPPSGAPS